MNKIHIGYPKTATTFLQTYIFPQLKNHEFLGHSEFHELGLMDLIYKADRSVPYKKFKKKFESGGFFISFEELVGPLFMGSMRIDEIPYRIKKVFGSDVMILITIRKQDELIRSTYIQYVHQGGTLKLKEFLQNIYLPHPRLDREAFNFLETYNRYSEVFGNKSIKVIPYEELKSDSKDFIRKIETFFGNEKLKNSKEILVNKSLSGNQLVFLRFLNNFLQSPLSQKFIISPKIFNQSNFRFKLQKSNFLRFGKSFSSEEEHLLKMELRNFKDSNRLLDNELDLNLKKYGYYN